MQPDPQSRPNRLDQETQAVDEVLAEGLRCLEEADSSGWRHVLRRHPDRAAELAQQALRLQAHGFYLHHTIPQRLGSYTLGRRLGQGGMGLVYLARRDGDQVDVALKLVRPEQLEGDQGRRRFRREVEAARTLHHPGIVKVLDIGTDEAVPWFAMELIEGESLADWIRAALTEGTDAGAERWFSTCTRAEAEVALPPWCTAVLHVIAQALDALQHAHERGTLHRDVKPSNILIDRRGRVALIDFGLAHIASATTITHSGETIGSLPYMAPELLRRGGEPSVATEVYAVGSTLYHALTRQLPFQGSNRESLRECILGSEPRALRHHDAGLPSQLEAVWRCAMAPEPHHRYRSAAQFAQDLRAFLSGAAPAVRCPGPWLRGRRWLRRHPLRALAAAAAVAFLVVLPTSLLWVQAAELRRTQRLSDLHMVGELCAREPLLWPARPEVVTGRDGMDAWIAQADNVLGRASRHADDLQAVRSGSTRWSRAELLRHNEDARRMQREIEGLRHNMESARKLGTAAGDDWLAELREHELPLQQRLDEIESFTFAHDDEARLHRHLASLLLGLADLRQRRERIVQRRQRATEWQEQSLVAGQPSWRETLEEIADRNRHPRYRGLTMPPQFGLLPLGPDPISGLFEFAHLPSGSPPRRGADGRFVIEPEHGAVLVLLPGGTVRVGADLVAGPHFDPAAQPIDTPSVEVRLDPFFIGKFELTQAQWVRQRGHNNCLLKPGHARPGAHAVTASHPVDFVTHADATLILAQLGLRIPTGAQWEYAARGGSVAPLWTNGDETSLDSRENLFDVAGDLQTWFPKGVTSRLQPADGWSDHAPVGRFAPNPFGLFDVLGNVQEWALDAVRPYSQGLAVGDGRTDNVDSGSIRGHAFSSLAAECRVSRRGAALHGIRAAGVRPSRNIEGTWTQDPDR